MTKRRAPRIAALALVTLISVPAVASAQGTFPGTSIPIPDLSGLGGSPWELPPSIQMPDIQQNPGGWTITFPGYPSLNVPDPSTWWGGSAAETPWEVPPGQPLDPTPAPAPSLPPNTNGWGAPAQPMPWPTPDPGYPAPNYPAPNYPAPGVAPGYPTPGYPAPGYPAPGYPTPGYPAPGYPTPGYPAPGYPTPGYPTPGAAPSYPTPALPGLGANPGAPAGRVAGVFAGITDYPSGSLDNCADDARNLAQAFVSAGIIASGDAIVLTDQQATRGNVTNALQQLASRMPADGTLVFFFSGHGDRTPDTNGDERDGMDETIVLLDGSLSDDELASVLQQSAPRDFVALDTCYAGGFRDDVARLPGSVGYYSSGENELSSVAGEFGAGGYLSHFMRTGIEQSRGRSLHVGQLGQHIEQGYRSSGANGRQNLVVGTGPGVSANSNLFPRGGAANALAAR
jgi:hypothetical protein